MNASSLLRSLRRGRGTVGAESALAMSLILVPMCGGAADGGVAIMTHARLDAAMQSTMMYLWSTTSATSANVQAAASASWGNARPALTTQVSAAACYCLPPGGSAQTATQLSCGSTCQSGQQLASYVTVTLSTSVTLPIPLPALPSPMAMSVSATVRTQ